MKMKMLAILCVLAILAGALGTTVTAQTQTETGNVFQAGYALVDINPYWSIYAGERKPATMTDGDMLPLPMAGYGDNAHRLSAPKLYDVNGDGKVSGPDGDGLQATVLAIRSGDRIVLFVTVDLISVKSALTKSIRTAIEEKTGIPGEYITVAGTHTHSGVDMTVTFSTSGEPFKSADGATSYTAEECNAYLTTYKAYLISQLADGAAAAVADLSDATMEKGSIDMLTYNDGKIMNNVRHYKQVFQDYESFFKKRTETYVRGSSFNNDVDDDGSYDSFYNYAKSSYWGSGSFASKNGEATTVSDSDQNMHVVQFKFANGKEPIAFVNWRAHPANANKKANGVSVYQNLGGDYISAMRYALDSYGYRSAFILGASGNLGMNTSVPSKTWISSAASAANKATTVFYGEILANAANDLMTGTNLNNAIIDPMHQIDSGAIMVSRLKYKYELNVPSEIEAKAAVAAKAAYAAGTAEPEYSYVYTDSTTKEKFVIASSYHAASAVGRAEYTAGQKSTMELNVITVGRELAFLALPYEASDRYSSEATLATANNYNDWDLLASVKDFGTPFVITCANDHRGYIPNQLAYTYNEDAKPAYKYAIGSYESQTTYAAKGEGEKIIDTLKTMLEQMEAKTEYCAYCEDTFTWTPLTASSITIATVDGKTYYHLPEGHYYLYDDFTYTVGQPNLKGKQLCLDLNGKTYSVNQATNASRAVLMSSGARLNIQDSSDEQTGVMMGHGVLVTTAPNGFGTGTLKVEQDCEVNFYGGTLTQDTSEQFHATAGGVVTVSGNGVFNMYGGTITGGKSSLSSNGGNVLLDVTTTDGTYYYPVFNMYDGVIKDGTAGGKGGNIYIESGASFKMYGGQILGGTASEGFSIYSQNGIVVLGGNAQINQVVFSAVPATRLRIDGTYTGAVNVVMPSTTIATGTDVGNAYNNANIDEATITIKDCDLPIKVVGDQLLLIRDGAPATVDAEGKETYYADVATALAAYLQANSTAVKLILHEDLPSLEVAEPSRDVYLDLNGCDVTALQLTGSKKLYLSDSATDDYTVEDGVGYGTVPVTANVAAAPGYMMINVGENLTFHKYEARLNSVNLRAGSVGMYYGSRFAGDELVKAQVVEYGVALRIGSAPTADSIRSDTEYKTHAGISGSTWQVGEAGNSSYGVLLKNIMKPGNVDAVNNRNAKYKIYAVTYMEMADGTILISDAVGYTLRQIVELVDQQFPKLSDGQKGSMTSMYETYSSAMSSWNIPNIKEFVGAE